MRMGGAAMMRTRTMICGLALATLLLSVVEAVAAGPGNGRGFAARGQMRVEAGGPTRHQAIRAVTERRFERGGDQRHGRHNGRRFAGLFGYVGPGLYPLDIGASPVTPQERGEPVDLNAFEHMPAQTGIARSPTPEPTIYRIEGPRDRPVARVIRFGAAEPRDGVRSRYVHAETGALLLTVPERSRR